MPGMTMRERILAVLQGREVDRVPFVSYDMLIPVEETLRELGPDRVGLLRWCKMFRVEHPHCKFEVENRREGERLYRTTELYTPAGTLTELRVLYLGNEPRVGLRRHSQTFRRTTDGLRRLCAYLEDCTILENYDQWHRDAAELGDHGWPLAHVERTPYQQLWIEWAGMEGLAAHLADCPEQLRTHVGTAAGARAEDLRHLLTTRPRPLLMFPTTSRHLPSGRDASGSCVCHSTTSWPIGSPSAGRPWWFTWTVSSSRSGTR